MPLTLNRTHALRQSHCTTFGCVMSSGNVDRLQTQGGATGGGDL